MHSTIKGEKKGLCFSEFNVYRGFLESQEPLEVGQEVEYFGYPIKIVKFGPEYMELTCKLITNDSCVHLPDPI